MEKQYHVSWEIEVYAESPREAAEKCLAIHRNPDSTATVFDVIEFESDGEAIRIDLTEDEEDEEDE